MKTTSLFRHGIFVAAIGTIFTTGLSSCSKDETPTTPAAKNIVELAQTDTTLSILVSAVSRAGLVNTLSTTANLTVFAPTNAAFRSAGYTQAVIDGLSAADVTNVLTPILTYHVVAAKVLAANVPTSDTVKTLNGKNIYASKNANGVFINGKTVTTADLSASNGVVHKINGVLIPPTQTIAQIVTGNPSFSTLLAALGAAQDGLVAALSGPGKFTVFAPDNDAFVTSGITTLSGITQPQAATIIKSHVIATNVFASDLINNSTAPTLNASQTLTITLPAAVKITTSSNPASTVTTANVVATNGVVHIINRVIL